MYKCINIYSNCKGSIPVISYKNQNTCAIIVLAVVQQHNNKIFVIFEYDNNYCSLKLKKNIFQVKSNNFFTTLKI